MKYLCVWHQNRLYVFENISFLKITENAGQEKKYFKLLNVFYKCQESKGISLEGKNNEKA